MTFAHCFLLLGFTLIWHKIPVLKVIKKTHFPNSLSVIIPFRNEAHNLKKLHKNLNSQSLREFELILIDDHSEDGGGVFAEQLIFREGISFRYIKLKNRKGKKAAISEGIIVSKGSLIITTDADCIAPTKWLESILGFQSESDADMIVAPVKMIGSAGMKKIQSVEFSTLLGLTAVSNHIGLPSTCNGANLAFKKQVFLDVKGYLGNQHIPSGDDEFLLQKFHKKGKTIKFLKSKEPTVETIANDSIYDFLNQRIRWTSKWKYQPFTFNHFMGVVAVLDFLSIAAILVMVFDEGLLPGIIFIFCLRGFVDYFYMRGVCRFLSIKAGFFEFIMISFFYPVYVLFLFCSFFFGNYTWKGRQYR